MKCFSYRPTEPAYYILDWRISRPETNTEIWNWPFLKQLNFDEYLYETGIGVKFM